MYMVLIGLMLYVATVLTVYGIETGVPSLWLFFLFLVATVLTVYGIETSYGELD